MRCIGPGCHTNRHYRWMTDCCAAISYRLVQCSKLHDAMVHTYAYILCSRLVISESFALNNMMTVAKRRRKQVHATQAGCGANGVWCGLQASRDASKRWCKAKGDAMERLRKEKEAPSGVQTSCGASERWGNESVVQACVVMPASAHAKIKYRASAGPHHNQPTNQQNLPVNQSTNKPQPLKPTEDQTE